ncbi:hypothetical protein HK102_013028 [Quaeritorhiza haematococci]|nr:hypothetical protein HK102_013028 [Quaeritorhiza haematococci]
MSGVCVRNFGLLRSGLGNGFGSNISSTAAGSTSVAARFICSPFAPTSISPSSQPLFQQQVRHASKKTGGSSRNGRDSRPKHLGVKKGDGEYVVTGHILVRQRGTQWHAGANVGMGRDHTLFALREGRVRYHYDIGRQRRIVSVLDEFSYPQPQQLQGETTPGFKVPTELVPSRKEMKKKLADRIDPVKYLEMTGEQRLKYVLETARELAAEQDEAQKQYTMQKVMRQGTRKFDLVDVTML